MIVDVNFENPDVNVDIDNAFDIDIVAVPGVTEQEITNVIEEHPEWVTTVQDGSLTAAKFSDALKLQTIKDYVTPEMYGAKGDGVTDDTQAIQNAVNVGKYVLFGSKTYLITNTIQCSGNISLLGNGATSTIINCTGNDVAFEFSNDTIMWYPPSVKVSFLRINSPNGAIRFSNITQGVIENCAFSGESLSTVPTIDITNESHCVQIRNNWIYGGIGINVVDSNALTIEGNYICYCSKGLVLTGEHHFVVNNDLEGGNTLSYQINCNGSHLSLMGERNDSSGAWIELNGHSNDVTVSMFSDGGSFYNPLISLTGRFNKIKVLNVIGYALFDSSVINSQFNIIDLTTQPETLLNTPLTPEHLLDSGNTFLFNEKSVIFDSAQDDVTSLITADSVSYSYDPNTKIITTNEQGLLVFDLSKLTAYNDQLIYFYIKKTGISASGHGTMAMPVAQGGRLIEIFSDQIICFPVSTNIRQVYMDTLVGMAVKIDSLKVSLTPNM